jgi:hypothetical protein
MWPWAPNNLQERFHSWKIASYFKEASK